MANAHRLVRNAWSNLLAAMPPALRVVSGDTIGTATLDAAGVNAAGRQPAGPPNPMNGPVYVEGADDTGWTRGALAANVVDPEAVRDLPPRNRVEWLIDREAATVRLQNAGSNNDAGRPPTPPLPTSPGCGAGRRRCP